MPLAASPSSQCLHFGCFACHDVSPSRDQKWWSTGCITLTTSPSNFQFPALNQINILVKDSTFDVTCFLCLNYFPIYGFMQISHMPRCKNQIAGFFYSCTGLRIGTCFLLETATFNKYFKTILYEPSYILLVILPASNNNLVGYIKQ